MAVNGSRTKETETEKANGKDKEIKEWCWAAPFPVAHVRHGILQRFDPTSASIIRPASNSPSLVQRFSVWICSSHTVVRSFPHWRPLRITEEENPRRRTKTMSWRSGFNFGICIATRSKASERKGRELQKQWRSMKISNGRKKYIKL